jgi:hypothetical protein
MKIISLYKYTNLLENQISAFLKTTSILFTLKNNSNPGLVLEQLVNIAQGKSSEPIWQSSGNSKYLNVSKYLQNAPLVNIKK